jgi:hypothetical protein
MRILIFALLMGIAFAGMAQNGGHLPENNTAKLEYIGGGKIKITNKQSFSCDFRVSDSKTESEITILGSSYHIYTLPADLTTNIHFKAKCITNNGITDLGWIELVLASLPLKFISFTTTRISDTEFWVNFEVAEVSNVNHFRIKASTDGKIYKVITIVFPDDIQPNRKYSVKVNLANYKN